MQCCYVCFEILTQVKKFNRAAHALYTTLGVSTDPLEDEVGEEEGTEEEGDGVQAKAEVEEDAVGRKEILLSTKGTGTPTSRPYSAAGAGTRTVAGARASSPGSSRYNGGDIVVNSPYGRVREGGRGKTRDSPSEGISRPTSAANATNVSSASRGNVI